MKKRATTTAVEFKLIDPTFGEPATGLVFAAGDVTISRDSGAFVNATNLPTEIGGGWYSLALTADEMTADRVAVSIVDQTDPAEWDAVGITEDTYVAVDGSLALIGIAPSGDALLQVSEDRPLFFAAGDGLRLRWPGPAGAVWGVEIGYREL